MYRIGIFVLLAAAGWSAAAEVPANINCASADLLVRDETDDSATAVVSFADLVQTTPPECANDDVYARWYRYIAPRQGAIAPHLLPGSDAELAVYADCGEDPLRCFADGRPAVPEDALLAAEAGGAFLLRVGASSTTAADTVLRVDFLEARSGRTFGMPGDTCEAATEIEDQIPLQFTFAGLTAQTLDACAAEEQADAWFAYTAPGSGALYVQACNFDLPTTLTVYEDCGSAPLLCVDPGCPEDQQRGFLYVREGATYRIRVTGYDGGMGTTTAVVAARFAGDAGATLTMQLPPSSIVSDPGPGLQIGEFEPAATFESDLIADLRNTSLGGFRIRLEYDPAVIQVTSVTPVAAEFIDFFAYNDSVQGSITIASVVFDAPIGQPTGRLALARVGFEVVGSAGDLSSVRAIADIDPEPGAAELYANDADLTPIPVVTEPVVVLVRQGIVTSPLVFVTVNDNARFPSQARPVSGALVQLGINTLPERPVGSGVYSALAAATGTAVLQVSRAGFFSRQLTLQIGAARNDWVVSLEPMETPNPVFHNGDRNGDARFSLSEVLRLVQLFNAPNGYFCAPAPGESEDGYWVDGTVPGLGRATCAISAADYAAPFWILSLSELLRQIQFFNADGMHRCEEGIDPDGLCAGP
ncbi:MAG: hypothetical protein GC168_17500 [Candidatus Hydrogenedens sp.]|nr:hypothetical protein [Candidatus Hydrogenedens sp.]